LVANALIVSTDLPSRFDFGFGALRFSTFAA
jgi:hypothetical protein